MYETLPVIQNNQKMLILRFYFDTSKGQMAQNVLLNIGDKNKQVLYLKKKRLILKTDSDIEF